MGKDFKENCSKNHLKYHGVHGGLTVLSDLDWA